MFAVRQNLLFLLWCVLLLTSGCALAFSNSPVPTNLSPANTPPTTAQLTHGPVTGAVTPNQARVFIRTNQAARVQLLYAPSPQMENARMTAPQATNADADFTTQFQLDGLEPATVYYLNVVVNGAPQADAPLAQFKTFPPQGSAQAFKFVHLTDSSVIPNLEAQSFRYAAAEQPDFVILGGDFPHGKHKTLQAARELYQQLYAPETSPSIRDLVERILRKFPIAHMWDDHDYGMNEGDKTNPLKAATFQALQEYFPLYPHSPRGDWQKFSYAQADFFLLDTRSQRDSHEMPDGPAKSMLDGDNLGAQGQWEWLTNGLRTSTARWKFILSPVVFNPTVQKYDAWRGFRFERNKLVRFIQEHHIQGVIFLSGDLHAGAIDDGTHSTFPEMLNNGPNGPGCLSLEGSIGEWSEGSYGDNSGAPCNGYGVITVLTNPDRVLLQVKDSWGKTRVEYMVQ